ncbi:MAG: LmeA family phospholipid-binding protein [Cyanobacteria bacterium RUI128]|nr:LmeA family phospholipid-binding protein [Cyanobacteria bacterium RUI128]
MKRIVLLMAVCLFTSMSVLPVCSAEANNCKTASKFVRVTTNMLGYNFIAKKIAQSALKKTLKKSAKGEYDVKIDSFSGVDLKKGKFKGLTIEGKNISVDDELFVSKLYMKTTSDFNYVDYRKDPIVFKTDVPMEYKVELSEADLNKSVTVGKTTEIISSILPLVTIDTPKLKLYNDKIKVSSALRVPFAKPAKFSMTADLKVENGKVMFSDIHTSGLKNEFADRILTFINQQNLLDNLNLDIFDNTDTNVTVNNVYIKDKTIFINGKLVIKKTK